MDAKDFLAEWALHYAQHLSVFHGKDDAITRHDSQVSVKGKESNATYYAAPDLDKFEPKAPQKNESIYVVTLNTKDNLEALEKHWKKYSEHRNVMVIFLNPKSTLDTKWTIHPYVHNRICDSSALHTGLKALFANVDPVKKADIASFSQ